MKETASRIHASSPDQDPEISLALATAAVNSTEYSKGYSSIQRAFGRQAELTDDELRQHFHLPIDCQQDQFARLLTQRRSAEEHARKARADHVLSRIKNMTVKQPRRNFDLAEPVMVWRKFLLPSFHKGVKRTVKPTWIGPGRVVLHELIPGQVEGDPVPMLGLSLARGSIDAQSFLFDHFRIESRLMNKQPASSIPTTGHSSLTSFPRGSTLTLITSSLKMERRKSLTFLTILLTPAQLDLHHPDPLRGSLVFLTMR